MHPIIYLAIFFHLIAYSIAQLALGSYICVEYLSGYCYYKGQQYCCDSQDGNPGSFVQCGSDNGSYYQQTCGAGNACEQFDDGDVCCGDIDCENYYGNGR